MNPAQAITVVREAGGELKRLDPAVGGIVDALVADIVAKLSEPARTRARTRCDAPKGTA